MLYRLLSGVAIILGLTIIIAILISAVLIAALFVFYHSALVYGLDPQASIILTFLLALIFILSLIICINMCLKKFRRFSKSTGKSSPIASMFDSFIAGFMEK